MGGGAALAGFYFLYFSAVGIVLPFLPPYLRTLSLSGSQIGLLLALSPLSSLLTPPLWGYLSDRTGRPARVLTTLCLGAILGFAPLISARTFGSVAASLGAYAFFAMSIPPTIDALTLERLERSGGSFARVRLFGSIGFVASSALFGVWVSQIDRRAVVSPIALWTACLIWTLFLPSPALRSEAIPKPTEGLALIRDRRRLLLLAACCLHWIACAPFHGMFGIHVTALGLDPWVIGASAGVGVIAEAVVMFFYPKVVRSISARRILIASFLFSAARWAVMAVARSPLLIVAISALHGMTFGAFYVAGISMIAERVPGRLRASGQALFAAATFGVGGLVGFVGAGVGYDRFGGPRSFGLAAGLELLAAAIASVWPW